MPGHPHIFLHGYTPVTCSPGLDKIVHLWRECSISLSLQLKQLLLATARVVLLEGLQLRVWSTSYGPSSPQSKSFWKLPPTHPAHGPLSLLLPEFLSQGFANTQSYSSWWALHSCCLLSAAYHCRGHPAGISPYLNCLAEVAWFWRDWVIWFCPCTVWVCIGDATTPALYLKTLQMK